MADRRRPSDQWSETSNGLWFRTRFTSDDSLPDPPMTLPDVLAGCWHEAMAELDTIDERNRHHD